MEDGTLMQWRMKKGDTVNRGDVIAEVETQKGLIEIEVFEEGTIEDLLIDEGTKVPVGTILALIKPKVAIEGQSSTQGEKAELQPIEEKPEVKPKEEKAKEDPTVSRDSKEKVMASPLAKRIATEHHIDLSQLQGSGEDGAITKQDVEQAITQQNGKRAKATAKKPSDDSTDNSAANAVRSAIAAAMSKSKSEIPHYYLEKNMDMMSALTWMNEANKDRTVKKRLLPAALMIKAVALALRKIPELNAFWENGLQLKEKINIGFVVALRNGGIIVPALHSPDLKTLDEIMEDLNDIIPRAKALKLRSSELSDSTITLTSIGEGGADSIYGIIYPPQVAIIGFGNISEQAFADKGMLGVRSMVRVSLAGDHRATDGLTGSRFLSSLNNYLQNPEEL